MEYKKGIENRVANALSRQMESELKPFTDKADLTHGTVSCFLLLSFLDPTWLDKLKDSYHEDEEIMHLIQSLHSSVATPKGFSLHNGFLLYKGRFYLGSQCSLKPLVLAHVYSSPVAGHSGFLKSFHRAKQEFYWKGMKSDLKKFIRECDVCQRIKAETIAPSSLLQTLAIPTKPWTDVSLYFVEGLPKSQGFEVILVVVDRLTKYVYFIPLSHPYTAAKVVGLYMQYVFKLHGLPTSIVNDRDATFTSKFWSDLFKLQEVDLAMSIAYHPQSDG